MWRNRTDDCYTLFDKMAQSNDTYYAAEADGTDQRPTSNRLEFYEAWFAYLKAFENEL